MKFSTNGLIIRQQNIGEQDRLVWVLSDSHGVFRAFVKRAQNIKSPKCAGTGLLCFSKMTVFEGRDSYTIDEVEAQEQFAGLRKDILRLSLAQYFCELSLNLAPKEQEADEYLRLTLNALYLLSMGKREPELIKFCYEMRLMSLCGYMPDLVMCPVCGKYESEQMIFRPDTGQLYCDDCAEKSGIGGITLPPSGVVALRHSVYADFDKLFSFTIQNPALIQQLSLASERYTAHMTSKDYQTLSYYKGLRTYEQTL